MVIQVVVDIKHFLLAYAAKTRLGMGFGGYVGEDLEGDGKGIWWVC